MAHENTISIGKNSIRIAEVTEINRRTYDAMNSARRRDAWFVDNLTDVSDDYPVTQDMIDEINRFWAPYSFAYQNNPATQLAFYKTSGVFDPSYVGFGLQRYSLVRFWNNETFATFRNKLFTPLLFPFIKHPENVIVNNYGVYLNENHDFLTEAQAVQQLQEALQKEGELILKPTLDSGSGQSIVFLNQDMSAQQLLAHFRALQQNFVCQRIIKNHPSFAVVGPKSLNTMRVCTLVHKNNVYLAGAALRMGATSRLDNWGQGGFVVQVREDGTLADFAVSERGQRISITPNGFHFSGHQLFRGSEVIQTAIACHRRISQQKYISWDFTVDDAGDIVLIEMNSPGGTEVIEVLGLHSYVNKQIAKEILDEYMIRRFFYRKAVYDWNYREFSNHISLERYCGDDKVVNVPAEIEGKKVTILYDNAFNNAKVKKVICPKSVNMNAGLLRNKGIVVEITD